MITAIIVTPRATPTAMPATAPLLRPFEDESFEAPWPSGELSEVALDEGVTMMVETFVCPANVTIDVTGEPVTVCAAAELVVE